MIIQIKQQILENQTKTRKAIKIKKCKKKKKLKPLSFFIHVHFGLNNPTGAIWDQNII